LILTLKVAKNNLSRNCLQRICSQLLFTTSILYTTQKQKFLINYKLALVLSTLIVFNLVNCVALRKVVITSKFTNNRRQDCYN